MTVTLESLKKAIGKKKLKTLAFAWLADLEREAGDLQTAMERVNGSITLYPNEIPARLVRTKILFQQGEFEACVQECEDILRLDPFCLSAQKRMGDAYDQLGNENERNKCYRKVHDMDPLDPFWKDEYEAVAEAAAVAAAASEMDLSMPDMTMPAESDDQSLSMDMSSDEGSSFGSFLEKSPEDSVVEEEHGPKFGSGFDMAFEDDEPAAEEPAADSFSLPAEEPAAETFADAGFSMDQPAAEDDPFAALSALLPNVDSADEEAMDSLQASLDSAMAEMASDEMVGEEVFPSDDDISGNDVTSALSSMFGVDDDLEPEAPAAPASPFSHLDLPTSIDDDSSAAASNASMIFGAPKTEESKPQSVDSAFSDIFGEDELPEEKPQAASAEESKPQSVDSAFNDIFGEDELPEEKPQAATPAEESKPQSVDSAFNDIFGEDELPEEKPQPAPAEEDKPQSVDNAFDSIFGEDELPEEKPQEVADDLNLASDLKLPAEETLSVEEPAAEISDDFAVEGNGSLFEKSADESLSLNEESVADEPVEAPAAKEADSVDSAFGSIFGDDDDLPEEKPQEVAEDLNLGSDLELPAEETLSVEEPAAETSEDLVVEGNGSLFEKSAEEVPEEKPAEESGFSVDNAFSSIFGDDDDLPVEKEVEKVEEPVEEASAESLAEQVVMAEDELELPAEQAPEAAEENDFAKEMGGAFSSMFGDDDLELPEEKAPEAPAEEIAAAPASQEDTGAAIEEKAIPESSVESDLDKSFGALFGEDDDLAINSPKEETAVEPAPASSLDNLESEVSGAFKGLFAEDDDLPEETQPSNKGVDFLMSGDSDDEVSVGLIKDPTASLDNGSASIDESLNTRTLAEIYFEQGLYGKALEIYQDLARKEPNDSEIQNRLSEVQKLYDERFGGNLNG